MIFLVYRHTVVKKIAILTSGGDCAGLNAVIRAVTLRANSKYNWEVYGIKDGTLGLLKDPLDVLKLEPNNFEGNLKKPKHFSKMFDSILYA